MSDSALHNISSIEDSLWAAADQLRANSKLTSSEYSMPVIGVIFLRNASGDVFGRNYEYFLMKFVMQGAQDNGEFFTPPSLVQTLVIVIEPDHGVVLDLACGSAGMFVQTSHCIEHEGLDTMQRVTFYGQEKTATTIRLSKMNLAVHGLEGDIREANSDARNIYRKIYDFSPEQQANLSAIVWLYRGQRERFLGLVQDYCKRLATANAAIEPALTVFETQLAASQAPLAAFAASVADLDAIPRAKRQPLADALAECSQAVNAHVTDRTAMLCGLADFVSSANPAGYRKPTELPSSRRKPGSRLSANKLGPALRHDDGAFESANDSPAREVPEAGLIGESEINTAQHQTRQTFDPLAEAARGLIKQIDLLYKLAVRAAQLAQELSTDEIASEFFDRRATGKLIKQLDEERKPAVEQLKAATYLHHQIAWLQDRFPTAEMQDVPGLCKLVSRAEIEAADWSLTPGRYVGVAPAEVDADFDFEQTLRDIHIELADLNREAVELAAKIQENFEELRA